MFNRQLVTDVGLAVLLALPTWSLAKPDVPPSAPVADAASTSIALAAERSAEVRHKSLFARG